MTSYFAAIKWPGPFWHIYEFVGAFLALGAIGFRFTALRGRLTVGSATTFQRMSRRAAALGLIGATLTFAHILQVLPRLAARAKVSVPVLLTTPSPNSAWFYLVIVAVLGFALATASIRAGWWLAAVAFIAALLRNAFVGQWGRLITPLHVLSGGLWLGTLFVLFVAGIRTLLRDEAARDGRSSVVAEMVNAFSPMALTCGVLVVLFGVWASLRELDPFSALWTTFYGYTLIAKLCVVAVVFALGAWNWRRHRPSLGTDAATHGIRKSATMELTAATIVLIITSIMLSLPEPH